MKKNFLLLFFVTSLLFVSCEKDDHDDECHECHIAFIEECCSTGDTCCSDNHQHEEHPYEIGEFCGDDLIDVEANGFTVTEAFTHDGETYDIGYQFPASMIHCEEHADHDHNH